MDSNKQTINLQGQVAVITGGAIRIGKALTLALAKAGCNIFLHYGRSEQAAQETKAQAEASGASVTLHSADLADLTAVKTIIPQAIKTFGKVDILINNAAIFPPEDTFSQADETLWQNIMDINLRAPFFLCQAFAQATNQGNIINILDARLNRPQTDHIIYRLTKGSLWQLTQTLALELAPHIRVNGVALGAMLPDQSSDIDDLETWVQERIPLNRYGSPQIVAQNVLHLLQQPFLTGVVIPLDGGEFL